MYIQTLLKSLSCLGRRLFSVSLASDTTSGIIQTARCEASKLLFALDNRTTAAAAAALAAPEK